MARHRDSRSPSPVGSHYSKRPRREDDRYDRDVRNPPRRRSRSASPEVGIDPRTGAPPPFAPSLPPDRVTQQRRFRDRDNYRRRERSLDRRHDRREDDSYRPGKRDRSRDRRRSRDRDGPRYRSPDRRRRRSRDRDDRDRRDDSRDRAGRRRDDSADSRRRVRGDDSKNRKETKASGQKDISVCPSRSLPTCTFEYGAGWT